MIELVFHYQDYPCNEDKLLNEELESVSADESQMDRKFDFEFHHEAESRDYRHLVDPLGAGLLNLILKTDNRQPP